MTTTTPAISPLRQRMILENSVDGVWHLETVVLQGFHGFRPNCSAAMLLFSKPLQHKAFCVPGHFNCGF